MTIGPIQAFLIGFPDNDLFEGRIADELMRLSDIGQIRVIDAVFVIREEDEVAVVSVSDLDDEQRAELRSAVGALVGLGLGGLEGLRQASNSRRAWIPMLPPQQKSLPSNCSMIFRKAVPPLCWRSNIFGLSRSATPSATPVES